MRWVKRILFALLVLFVVVAAAGAYFWHRLGKAPDWYKPRFASTQEVDRLVVGARDKLYTLHNWAGNPRTRTPDKFPPSDSPRAEPGSTSKTVRLTENELNALFVKWWTPQINGDPDDFAVKVNHYLSDPQVKLEDDEVVLAGTVKGMDKVIGLHLASVKSPDGPRMQLVSISGGRVSVPRWTIQAQIDRANAVLINNLPNWQRDARIDEEGLGNEDAGNALAAKSLILLLAGEPIDPVAFIPAKSSDMVTLRVPARVTTMRVADGELELTFEMLASKERAALEEYIRAPLKAVK